MSTASYTAVDFILKTTYFKNVTSLSSSNHNDKADFTHPFAINKGTTGCFCQMCHRHNNNRSGWTPSPNAFVTLGLTGSRGDNWITFWQVRRHSLDEFFENKIAQTLSTLITGWSSAGGPQCNFLCSGVRKHLKNMGLTMNEIQKHKNCVDLCSINASNSGSTDLSKYLLSPICVDNVEVISSQAHDKNDRYGTRHIWYPFKNNLENFSLKDNPSYLLDHELGFNECCTTNAIIPDINMNKNFDGDTVKETKNTIKINVQSRTGMIMPSFMLNLEQQQKQPPRSNIRNFILSPLCIIHQQTVVHTWSKGECLTWKEIEFTRQKVMKWFNYKL